MYSFWAMYSLRMSFWSVPPTFSHGVPCFSATARYIASAIGAVELIVIDVVTRAEVDPVEEHLHVAQRVDRDAALADLAARHVVVRVVAVERRQVERRREPGLSVLEQVVEALRWSASPCRSRRTGASSRACRGTRSAGRRACTGYSPGQPRSRSKSKPGCVSGAGQRLDRRTRDRRPVLLPGGRLREGLRGASRPSAARPAATAGGTSGSFSLMRRMIRRPARSGIGCPAVCSLGGAHEG